MLGCRVRWVGNGKIGRGDAAPLSWIRPKAGYTGISVGKVDERYVMLPIHSIVDKGARKARCITFLLKTHPFQLCFGLIGRLNMHEIFQSSCFRGIPVGHVCMLNRKGPQPPLLREVELKGRVFERLMTTTGQPNLA